MLLIRLAILAIAIGVAFPARFSGWLVSGAECTAVEGPGCQGAPLEEDDAPLVAAEIVDADDDDGDGQSVFVPPVSPPVFPARPRSSALNPSGLTASHGVFGSLFRPPRATV